ncbi:ubiquitin ligase [Babesia ovis]|uniref:HECT-type E3 ubiquitin transferase n=1 Tax=Babesia ovis TaxID=5869 RepID=A0A9W5TA59_BABOV|nr:ubiquitin ligase [Babesia ovis]
MKIGVPRGDNYKLVLAGLQLTQRDYIELLATCSNDDLYIHLESFTQWVWEKSDILCWAPVLNRFDDIFRCYLDPYRGYLKGEHDSITSFYNDGLLGLVRSVLKASVMIVENCTSKSMYNSLELLVSFLDDVHPDIVFLATKLLCVYFSRQRRHMTPKDVPEVSARISNFAQSPLPDFTCQVYRTVGQPPDVPPDKDASEPVTPESFGSLYYSDVIDYYVLQHQYHLTTDSYIEVGQEVTRGNLSTKLRVPVTDILNIHGNLSASKPVTFPHTKDGNERFSAAALEWKHSLSSELDLYSHMVKTLRLIIKKYKIEDCYYAELKYKFCKVYSLYFPFLQRRTVDVRICALICMLIMNNASYTQFLNHNPSFLLELTHMVKRHKELERSTMVIITELLSAMVYDGLHCKTLVNLFGMNMSHGIFSKVLRDYLHHPYETVPLPPLLRFKTDEETQIYPSMAGLWARANQNPASDMDEEGMTALQLKGNVVPAESHLAEWETNMRVSSEKGMNNIQDEEDTMRILLQLLVVFYTFISYHGCSNALANTSVLEGVVHFIRVRDPIYLPVVIYLVQVLEALLDYNQVVSRILRNDLKVFHVFVSRMQFDMYLIEKTPAFDNIETESILWPQGWKIPPTTDLATLRSYWMSMSDVSARRFLLKTLVRNIDTAAHSMSGRTEAHEYDVFSPNGAMVPIIHSIFTHPLRYGLSVYSSAINLVSDCLSDDPILQEDLHRLDIMPAMMKSICEENLKSEDCLHVIPTAICDVLLHRTGREYMKNNNYEPVLKLIDIIPNKDFVLFDRFGEVASTIGMSLDSIVRNHDDAYGLVMRRIVSIMYNLLQEASTFPPFNPQDSGQCAKALDNYMHEFRTNSPEITLEILRSLDGISAHEFYADRISHLGKCLSTFLCYPQTLSRFISCDGLKLLYQLCSVPCLPPLSLLIYSQHPLAIVLKFILAQAPSPCITYLHNLCRPYLLQPTSYRIPKTHDELVKNLEYMKMLQGISYTLYLVHRDSSTFYETCCSGQYQIGASALSRCEMHSTLSAYLKLMITEMPHLMKNFFMATNEGDLETFFILSGKHTPHDHPQLKAYKMSNCGAKNPQNSSETSFSANDLFWSSQFAFAYSNPNPAYNGSLSNEVSDDNFKMNTEVCRLSLVTCKAILYALTGILNKCFSFSSSTNTCMQNYVAHHLSSFSLLCISMLSSVPSMENIESGSGIFVEGMDCMNTARFVAEAMEMTYKLFMDDRTVGGIYMLSFVVFARMSGIYYVKGVFDYMCNMYLGCALTLALRSNPGLTVEDVLGSGFKGNLQHLLTVVDCLRQFDIKKVKYTMEILGRSIQICLGFFGKICNPKTVLQSHYDIEILAYTSSPAFCNIFPDVSLSIYSLMTSTVITVASTCWEWLQLIGSVQSLAPGNSTASLHFYISSKVIGSLLKLHVYVLDFLSESRQEILKTHFDADTSMSNNNIDNSHLPLDGRSNTTRRNRRHRRFIQSIRPSDSHDGSTSGYNMEEVRTTLLDMGFTDNDITRALNHCGYTDVSTLADWLINRGDLNLPVLQSNSHGTADPITIDTTDELPVRQETVDSISEVIKNSKLFAFECGDVKDDVELWNFPSFRRYDLNLDLDFVKLRDDINSHFISIILVLSTKMSSALPLIFEYLLRASSLHTPLTIDVHATPCSEDSQNQHALDLFNFIYNSLDNISNTMSMLKFPMTKDDLLPVFCPVVFADEAEKQVAFESTVLSGKQVSTVAYNVEVAQLHERLLGLFYILAHLIGGRDSYASLLLKNVKNPIEVILNLIETFQKLRHEALKAGVLTFAGIGVKPSLPGIAISLPDWCMQMDFTKAESKDKAPSKATVEYGLAKYGFIRHSDVPQLSCTPPFFKYAMVCISELLKKHSLIGLSNILSSSMDLSKNVEILSATKNVPYISKSAQQKLVTMSLSILEWFPGSDPDLVFSLLSILDGLTEVYSNVVELLHYKRLPPQENYPAHFNRRIDLSDVTGGDALSILLMIPRTGECKGMLKMIASILLHCMENPVVLYEAIEKRVVSVLSSNDNEPIALATLVDKVFPFTKKDPVMLLEILQKRCVLTLEEGVTNVDLSTANVTLRSSPRISDLLASNDDLISPGNIPTLEASNKDRTTIDSLVLLRGILRLIVVYMQIFCNIHGMTRIAGAPCETSKPGYPLALTVNSLFYLVNTLCHNFPVPVNKNRLPKVEFDLPNTTFPWKLNMVNVEDSHLVLVYIIRRIFMMLCALSVHKPKDGAQKGDDTEVIANHKFIVSTLENYTNSILFICSTSMSMCVVMYEELKALLLFLMGLNVRDCGSQFLTVATYTVCSLLHNMLQLRFEDGSHAELSPESVFQVKKCLTNLLHKLDLDRDGSNVLCGAIIRDLVLLTTPDKMRALSPGAHEAHSGLDGYQSRETVPAVDISLEVDSDSDGMDDSSLSSDEDMSESDSEELEEYMEDAMDEDIATDSSDEQGEVNSETEPEDEESQYDSDSEDSSDDSTDSDDLDTDVSDTTNDVEMALPHQVDEHYVSINNSEPETNSSLDEVDDEEDDDDAPRIRVIGELDEETRDESITDVMEDTRPHINVAEGDNNEILSGYSSSSDGDEFGDGNPVTSVPSIANSIGSNNVSINIEDPNLTLPGTANNGIRIQIEISNNPGSVRYLDSPSNPPSVPMHMERPLHETVAMGHTCGVNHNETWAQAGDLLIPTKHPMLPSTKKFVHADRDFAGEVINLIALSLPRVQLPRATPPETMEPLAEQRVPSGTDSGTTEDSSISGDHSSEQNLPSEGDPAASTNGTSSSTPHAYFNRHLDRIATAMGISYAELFTLANMDISVIAELPEEIREEVIAQQLSTIDADALATLRGNRPTPSVTRSTSTPTPEEMQYIDSLPRSLRSRVFHTLFGSGTVAYPDLSVISNIGRVEPTVLTNLPPALRNQLFPGTPQEFFDNLAPELMNLRNAARNRLQNRGDRPGEPHLMNISSEPLLNAHALLSNIANLAELANAEARNQQSEEQQPHQPALTFGVIIGDMQDDANGNQRGNNTPRIRNTGGSRRFTPSMFRRRGEGNTTGRGMGSNDIIVFDDHGVRVTHSSMGAMEGLGRIPHSVDRMDLHLGGSEPILMGSGRREGLDDRIIQSLPQLFHTFQPHLFNMLTSAGRGIAPSGIVPVSTSPDGIVRIDTNIDISCDKLVESVIRVIPRSACESHIPRIGDRNVKLLDVCHNSKNDFAETDIVGMCKMMYLKDEINKKIYFKLLYNLTVSDVSICHLVLKCFLYIMHTSILALSNNCVSTIRSDEFFLNFPRLCSSPKDEFPPSHLYGALPYRYVTLDGTVDSDQKQPLEFLTSAGPSPANFGCVDLNVGTASYVSCERVLEQLRSLLIAVPNIMEFFGTRVATLQPPESSSCVGIRSKRNRTSNTQTTECAGTKDVYPIGFLFMATATKLFQSSPKLMNHLLMVIQHLLVQNPSSDTEESINGSDAIVDSSEPGYTIDVQESNGSESESEAVDTPIHRTTQTEPRITTDDTVKRAQQEILNNLDSDAVNVFLDIHASWRHQSHWLQACHTGRDSASSSQMQVVAKILSVLYLSPKQSTIVRDFFVKRMADLIEALCNSLAPKSTQDSSSVGIMSVAMGTNSDDKFGEVEHRIFALVRIVNLVNDMFAEASQYHVASETPESGSSHGKLNEFYSQMDFENLWITLDTMLTNLCKASAPPAAADPITVGSTPLSSSRDNLMDNPEILEQLQLLVPLIEVFMTITQIRVALDYSVEDITDLDSAMSLVNFDYELPDDNLDFLAVARQERAPPKKEPWDGEESTMEISPNHLSLIYFTERHSRALNCMIRQTPSLLSNSFVAIVRLAPNCLDFDLKRQYFRQKLKEGRQGLRLDTVRISVRREHVFLDSYHQLRLRSGDEMKGKLSVSFGGEEGVDAGGLTREWFNILAKEMFNPNYGLFRREGRKQEFNHPNPLSGINPDHLNFFKFIGRVIGKAVYDGQHIDAYFCRSFYKHMLCRKITPADAESVDPQFYENLTSINNCRLEDMGLELFFSTEIDEFGKVKVIDLVPDGRNIPVTDENKQKYIELLCRHKVTNGIKDQLDAFMSGFQELIAPELISIFDDKELELLISGIPTIDLGNLRENVEYVGYTESSDQIVWLWEFLEGLDQNNLAAFLQFVTGTSRVPIGGFKNLMGMRGPQRISIHRTYGSDRLPSAHTCFNQLDLPAYATREKLHQKMMQAIVEGKEGFGFI